MSEKPELAKALYTIDDTGLAICTDCHLQLGEGMDNCVNCALAEYEYDVPKLERVARAAPGMMEIAETAMPDTYFQSDSRVCEMREALKEVEYLFNE